MTRSPEHAARPASSARATLLEAVLDELPVALGLWASGAREADTRTLTLVAMNRHAAVQAGNAQRIGMTMEEMGSAGVDGPTSAAILSAIREGVRHDLGEGAWTGADGVERWCLRSVIPIGGAAAVVAIDVTERRRLEEAATLLRALADAAPMGLSVWRLEDAADPGSFVLEAINAEGARMAGADAADLIGRRLDELSPSTLRSGREALQKAIASGSPADSWRVSLTTRSGAELEVVTKLFPMPGGRVGISVIEVKGGG